MNVNYQERKCKNCGGGKFINHPWGIECWYCNSEYENEKNVSRPHIRRYPSIFTATYFSPISHYHTPTEDYAWNKYTGRFERYWP